MDYCVREIFGVLVVLGVLVVFEVFSVLGFLDVWVSFVFSVFLVFSVFFSETCNCCLSKVRRRCKTTMCFGGNIYLPEGQSYICVLFHKMK